MRIDKWHFIWWDKMFFLNATLWWKLRKALFCGASETKHHIQITMSTFHLSCFAFAAATHILWKQSLNIDHIQGNKVVDLCINMKEIFKRSIHVKYRPHNYTDREGKQYVLGDAILTQWCMKICLIQWKGPLNSHDLKINLTTKYKCIFLSATETRT